jgi:DNA gyrase subunit A
MTDSGYIKRVPADVYTAQRRGGKGIIGMGTKEEDLVRDVMIVHSHSTLLMFTNLGRVYAKKAYQIPEASRTAKGTNAVNIIELNPGEKVTSIISVNGFLDDEYFVMVTRGGVIKRANVKDFEYQRKGGKIAINLDEGDELAFVRHTTGENEVVIATHNGRCARFDERDARVMGRTARGVRGIKLKGDDYVIGCEVVDNERNSSPSRKRATASAANSSASWRTRAARRASSATRSPKKRARSRASPQFPTATTS